MQDMLKKKIAMLDKELTSVIGIKRPNEEIEEDVSAPVFMKKRERKIIEKVNEGKM
jgi:hypothetical protein